MSPKSSISKLTRWMVSPTSSWSSAILASSSLLACGEASSPRSGPGLTLAVAPLSLPGITDACYDLRVWVDKNGNSAFDSGDDDVVWAKGNPAATKLGQDQTIPPGSGRAASSATADGDAICATQYGSATKGDITFIGSCDASGQEDADPAGEKANRVTVWFDGLYNGGAEVGEWQDPCGTNGCTLDVLCEENADARVEFNFTVMRDANQGFFDIAVNFKDIFCSAKLDTCYGTEPIKLVFGADSTRDWTAVFGFACTSGAGAANNTRLMYSDLKVTCGATIFPIDPTLAKGNQSVTVGADTLHYGIYRGAEQLNCDDASTAGVVESCNKLYWNLAFSLDDLAATGQTCTLAFSATAAESADFNLGVPASAAIAYPYIEVDATLTTAPTDPADPSVIACQANPLNGSGSAVKTGYRGSITGTTPPRMCSASSSAATDWIYGRSSCSDYYINVSSPSLTMSDSSDPAAPPWENNSVFTVSGTTDLPAGTQLNVRVLSNFAIDAAGTRVAIVNENVVVADVGGVNTWSLETNNFVVWNGSAWSQGPSFVYAPDAYDVVVTGEFGARGSGVVRPSPFAGAISFKDWGSDWESEGAPSQYTALLNGLTIEPVETPVTFSDPVGLSLTSSGLGTTTVVDGTGEAPPGYNRYEREVPLTGAPTGGLYSVVTSIGSGSRRATGQISTLKIDQAQLTFTDGNPQLWDFSIDLQSPAYLDLNVLIECVSGACATVNTGLQMWYMIYWDQWTDPVGVPIYSNGQYSDYWPPFGSWNSGFRVSSHWFTYPFADQTAWLNGTYELTITPSNEQNYCPNDDWCWNNWDVPVKKTFTVVNPVVP